MEVTSGGHALKFYASQRLNIKRIGSVKQGEEVHHHNVFCSVSHMPFGLCQSMIGSVFKIFLCPDIVRLIRCLMASVWLCHHCRFSEAKCVLRW